ncbi:unnamed protein product [Cuscuta europaea]|uniref:Endonuclease/exonuclease/phosphatase domain-containing protein n=1 Tax=Cuscuta europaea TaxID=41803 RepID=A0A9P0YK87_CUSEU|nr:unnamed protein product [Cuscuta europaea]
MEIVSWNCRGLGNLATVQVLIDVVQSKRPGVLFLMETKVNRDKCEELKTQLGFCSCFAVDSFGQSGGLCLMWRDGIELQVCNYEANFIDSLVKFETDDTQWRFT